MAEAGGVWGGDGRDGADLGDDGLAAYKALQEIQFVDAIPKTASGKILRRVLKEEERKRLGLA